MAEQYAAAPDFTIDLATTYSAVLRTNHGDITVQFDAEGSPQTVNNWIFLAREGSTMA